MCGFAHPCLCGKLRSVPPCMAFSPHGQDVAAQEGGHLTGHRWQRQTDREGGDINTLINNYLNNDNGYTRVGGSRDRRMGEGDWKDTTF